MFPIRPHPRSSIGGAKSRMRCSQETDITSRNPRTVGQSHSVRVSGRPYPALLINTSTSISSRASSKRMRRGASGSVRSAGITRQFTPCASWISVATDCKASSRRAVSTRSNPRSPRWRAKVAPMPVLAPVTSAVRGLSVVMATWSRNPARSARFKGRIGRGLRRRGPGRLDRARTARRP